MFVVCGVILVLMFSLLSRFFYLQVYDHELYKQKADVNRIRAIPLNAPRGLILDRNNEIIVDNYPTYLLTAIPGEMIDKNKNFEIISRCTGIAADILETNYKKYYRGNFLPVRLAKDLTFDQLSRIEEYKQDLTGINYVQFHERYFPSKINASHILGYVKEVDQTLLNNLDESKDYTYGDLIGWRGLEKVYENKLRGKKGARFVEVDAFGREMGKSNEHPLENPVPGNDLKTSIEISLQRMLEQHLDGQRAVALVSRPITGEILAMVSKPDYSPNLFTGTTSIDTWHQIISDPNKPLLNRVTHGLYPPGSTLKMITAMSLIEERKVGMNETVECTGVYELGDRIYHCWKEIGHGEMNLESAIAQSCNIYFYHFVQRLSLDEWSVACRSFGFGASTNIDLSSEAIGIVPNSQYMNKIYGRWGWSKGHLLNLSLGQGELVVTPIQMLRYINMISLNGQSPRLRISELKSNELFINDRYSKRTWLMIKRLMNNVVASANGTGKLSNPKINGLKIAGKTGTAQNPHGEPHAWFVGYGEKENEIISLVILVENGGNGSEAAAPIAKIVFEHIFKNNAITKLAVSQ